MAETASDWLILLDRAGCRCLRSLISIHANGEAALSCGIWSVRKAKQISLSQSCHEADGLSMHSRWLLHLSAISQQQQLLLLPHLACPLCLKACSFSERPRAAGLTNIGAAAVVSCYKARWRLHLPLAPPIVRRECFCCEDLCTISVISACLAQSCEVLGRKQPEV